MFEQDAERVRQRRALRATASFIFALLALGIGIWLALDGRFEANSWMMWERAVFYGSFAMSLVAGWRPWYETMFGDQSYYVDEPEVDDDW